MKRFEFIFCGDENKFAGIMSVTIIADTEEEARTYLQSHQNESLKLFAELPLDKGIIHIAWDR